MHISKEAVARELIVDVAALAVVCIIMILI